MDAVTVIALFALGLLCGFLLSFPCRPLQRQAERILEQSHSEFIKSLKDHPVDTTTTTTSKAE